LPRGSRGTIEALPEGGLLRDVVKAAERGMKRNVVEHVRDEETNDLVGYFGE
jgi:hypothetical protein